MHLHFNAENGLYIFQQNDVSPNVYAVSKENYYTLVSFLWQKMFIIAIRIYSKLSESVTMKV